MMREERGGVKSSMGNAVKQKLTASRFFAGLLPHAELLQRAKNRLPRHADATCSLTLHFHVL